MLETTQNVLPVFILIFVGWGLVACGYVKANTGEVLSQFIFKVAVPLLLFRALAAADFRGVFPIKLWITYFAGVVAVWAIAEMWVTRVLHLDHRIATIAGISSAFANTVFIGLPIVDRIVGSDGLIVFSILIVVHQPVLMIAATVLVERSVDSSSLVQRIDLIRVLGRSLWRNPLVYGTVGGILYQMSGLPLTGMAKGLVDQVAGIAGPGALLSLGMALQRYGFARNYRLPVVITLLKLFVMPAVVLVVAKAIDLPSSWTTALVLIASVPTGVNAWLIAGQIRTAEDVAASSITMTTVFGIFSVTFWAWLLRGF